MQDCFKRNIDYLRVSLTSNCNLRCQYCMPEQKIKQTEEMLSQKDLIHLVELISLTGIKNKAHRWRAIIIFELLKI